MYNPPFNEIENASKEELLKIIRKTKVNMSRLINKMEHPNYASKPQKCPSDLTVYKCDKYFLEKAIIHYIAEGGNYKRSKKELNDIKFNEKLSKITKITFLEGEFLGVYNKTVVDLTENGVKFFKGDKDEAFLLETTCEKQDFLTDLAELHIGEWRKSYTTSRFGVYVLDGREWQLKIEYNDGSKKEFYGSNAYPYNFKELTALLRD